MSDSIILASSSPRRKQLLEQAEINFEIVVPDIDESYPEELAVKDVPEFIAQNKAKAIIPQYPDRIILAADTIVVINDKILGKPEDLDDAVHILKQLNGLTHKVITGVCIYKYGQMTSISDTTEVSFHELSDDQIHHYVQKYKPLDKAGAYAIQEYIGVVGIKSINGCFYNVMGLPVSKILPYIK